MGTYLTRSEAVEARQWAAGTCPDELAEWCGGWTYTGDRHGHTDPHWALHTCLNLDVRDSSPKGHADPGDWLIRHGDGTFEILPPGEFAQRYVTENQSGADDDR